MAGNPPFTPQQREALQSAVRSSLEVGFHLPPKLSCLEWSERYRILSSDVTSKPGKFKALPYQRELLDAPFDPTVRVVVMMLASRLCKTETMMSIIGYTMDQDPSSMLVVYPTLDSAEKWSKQFFMPMVRATPRLRGLVDDKSRDAGNTMLFKRFPGGSVSAIGSNSPSGFRQVQARVILLDEIDAMEEAIEGDPVSLAFKRAENYPNAIKLLCSTPTERGKSRIEKWYERSDQRRWFCPCLKCGKTQTLKFAMVKWPKGKPEAAVLECEHCSNTHDDDGRFEMVMNGTWRPTWTPTSAEDVNRDAIRGYHLNYVASLFPPQRGFTSKLHQIAQECIEAKHSDNPAATTRTWVNTALAETYVSERKEVNSDNIPGRPKPGPNGEPPPTYGPELPEGVLVLTAGVDVQDDRLEAELVGWGIGEESWGIERVTFPGDYKQPHVWNRLDEWLLKRRQHVKGAMLSVACAFIDSSDGDHSRHVYAFVEPRLLRNVYASKGFLTPGMPIVGRSGKSSVKEVPLIMVGTDEAKSIILTRLGITEKGPGYMHFPVGYGYDDKFFVQLTAEQCVFRHEKGRVKREWVKKEGQKRNEGLDIRVYALSALAQLNPDWEALAQAIATAAPRPKLKFRPAIAGGGWVNNW